MPAKKRSLKTRVRPEVAPRSRALPAPSSVAELLLQFGAPLFATMRPDNLADLRAALVFVTTCWNVPLLSAPGRGEQRAAQEELHRAIARMPALVAVTLLTLLDERRATLEERPWLVATDVEGDTFAEAKVSAWALGVL